jgi:hypothetical protein
LGFDKAHAAHVIFSLNLAPTNQAIAEHWLSLWNGDRLPPRSALSPARIKPYLPSLLLFEVRPMQSVTVKLTGTLYARMLGTELTGADWIAIAPPDFRDERMKSFADIAEGGVYVAHRESEMEFGPKLKSQELLLPFAPDVEGAAHIVLCHLDWPERDITNKVKITPGTHGKPFDITQVSLTRIAEKVGA